VWRAEGRLGLLTRALAGSWPMVYLGRLDQARADAEEGVALAEETGEKIAWLGLKATAALVAVLRGETETAGRASGELRAAPLFPGMRFAVVMAQQVDGLRALFAGDAETAYRLLAQAFDPADEHYHSVSRWLLAPDLADAAIAAGTADQARHLIAGLPLLAGRLPSEMMTVAAAYTGAVLCADTESEARYVEALAALPAGWPLARARLHLHHGRWLRQHRRDVEARKPLRAARDEFERIGAWAWAAAAREPLRAAGEASGGPPRTPAAQLSAQELQIVVLASQGLTNREIGQRLFLSHRTVGSQLYRIYPRLGVSSRRELAAALNGQR
jgi:DNA-binding CsgD family transcriptional regulator